MILVAALMCIFFAWCPNESVSLIAGAFPARFLKGSTGWSGGHDGKGQIG